MKPGFRAWAQERQPVGAASRESTVARLESAYGDLSELNAQDGLRSLIADLNYSSADARASRPNPSKIPIAGNVRNGLATLKSTVLLYQQYLNEIDGERDPIAASITATTIPEKPSIFGLERDLQSVLRAHIDQLEPSLTIIDGGAERKVASGFIDITAEDATGAIVVIELKAGQAGRDAIGQILAYMGDMSEEEADTPVRGIIVASGFDHRVRAAARLVPSLRLRSYSVAFSFADADHEDRRLSHYSSSCD